MFQNVLLPSVPVDQMHGVMALLALIGNPQSEAAAEFLKKLSEEKDHTIEVSKKVAEDRAESERLHRETKDKHASIVDRLSQMEADLRERITAHATAAESLTHREEYLAVKQTQHDSDVAAHRKDVEAASASHSVRETALAERELKLAEAHADLERRTAEFNKHMGPVLAAAALAM